jgi:hypothetical protein
MMNDMLDPDARQAIYQRARIQHSNQWFQADAEDFCTRKQVDPASGRYLPGAYIHEET